MVRVFTWVVPGIPDWYLKWAKERKTILQAGAASKRPDAPVPVPFVPKCSYIPKLESYRGVLPPEYWATWPRKELDPVPRPWISPTRLRSFAMSIGFPDMQWVNRVADSLENGFRIGARGQGRANAEGKNLKSFYEEGFKAADAVADWITKGLMTGPFDRLVNFKGFCWIWMASSIYGSRFHPYCCLAFNTTPL